MEGRCVVKQIVQSLLELLSEKEFHAITITMIVQKAQVGRASFYRNFSSKEDVIRQHMAGLLKEWGEAYEALGRLDELLPSLLRHFYKHRDFYLLLYKRGLSHYILDAVRGAMDFSGKSDAEVYSLNWFAGGLYGVVTEWMRRGMEGPPEEVKRILQAGQAES